jgi:hypothetical protein
MQFGTLVKNNFLYLPALMTIGSAIGKFAKAAPVVESLTKVNMVENMTMLGLAEIVFAALYLYRPTGKIGLLLLTAYFGGAFAADLSHLMFNPAPLVILTLIWIGAYLRDKSAFLAD